MGKVILGHVDRAEAIWLRPSILVLVGNGTNPSTGWKNWFEPMRTLNHYEFKQEEPDGITAPVILPFHVTNVFHNPDAKEIVIHEIVDGKPGNIRVPVRHATMIDEGLISRLSADAGMAAGLLERSHDVAAAASGTSARRHLGTVDIPFGCADWKHPLRAKRIEFFLVVEVAGQQEIENAITDCLKQSAIAAALATMLTPIGWAAGLGLFKGLVLACLATKLHNIVRVDIDHPEHCL